MLALRSAGRVTNLLVGVGVILSIAVGIGCAQSGRKAAPPRSAAPEASRSTAQPPKHKSSADVAGVASQVHMTFTDPSTGKVLWKAAVGRFEAVQQSGAVVGNLHKVDGVLYEAGKPANRMLAPMVKVDNQNKTVTATGGVHVISLTQKDTDLRCDSATWYIKSSKLIGTGNVVMHKATFTQTGPSFEADTRLQSVQMPAPSLSGSVPAGGHPRVHAHMH